MNIRVELKDGEIDLELIKRYLGTLYAGSKFISDKSGVYGLVEVKGVYGKEDADILSHARWLIEHCTTYQCDQHGEPKLLQGIICDLDDTIVSAWTTELLPGVAEFLKKLTEQIYFSMTVCTNQAGPAWRAALMLAEQEYKKFPEAKAIAARLVQIARATRTENIEWFISTYDQRIVDQFEFGTRAIQEVKWELQKLMKDYLPNAIISESPGWRKPQPGMLLAAHQEMGLENWQCIYVGDMDGSKTDKKGQPLDSDFRAAQNAGTPFVASLAELRQVLGEI